MDWPWKRQQPPAEDPYPDRSHAFGSPPPTAEAEQPAGIWDTTKQAAASAAGTAKGAWNGDLLSWANKPAPGPSLGEKIWKGGWDW